MGKVVPLGAAHAPEEDGFRTVARLERRFGQGRPDGVDRGAPDEGLDRRVGEVFALGGGLDGLQGFAHDFGADAVARENGESMVSHGNGRKFG